MRITQSMIYTPRVHYGQNISNPFNCAYIKCNEPVFKPEQQNGSISIATYC